MRLGTLLGLAALGVSGYAVIRPAPVQIERVVVTREVIKPGTMHTITERAIEKQAEVKPTSTPTAAPEETPTPEAQPIDLEEWNKNIVFKGLGGIQTEMKKLSDEDLQSDEAKEAAKKIVTSLYWRDDKIAMGTKLAESGLATMRFETDEEKFQAVTTYPMLAQLNPFLNGDVCLDTAASAVNCDGRCWWGENDVYTPQVVAAVMKGGCEAPKGKQFEQLVIDAGVLMEQFDKAELIRMAFDSCREEVAKRPATTNK